MTKRLWKQITLYAPRYVKVPNLAVYVDYRARSACYPRSSFYPLIFHLPMKDGRFTNFRFRDCASCSSCSKAGLCVCTSSSISIRAKPTFVNASVTVWEATAPVKLPIRHCLLSRFHGRRLGPLRCKGGVSLTPFGSHLRSTCRAMYQCQIVVKLHGVFSSSCGYVASSRHLHFHRGHG